MGGAIVDVFERAQHRDAPAAQVCDGIGKSKRARPPHTGEGAPSQRGASQPYQPIAAVRRRSDDRVGCAQAVESRGDIPRPHAWRIAADNHYRAFRQTDDHPGEADAQLAPPLRPADRAPQPIAVTGWRCRHPGAPTPVTVETTQNFLNGQTLETERGEIPKLSGQPPFAHSPRWPTGEDHQMAGA